MRFAAMLLAFCTPALALAQVPAALTLDASSAIGGRTIGGTVRLSSPAPAGGLAVHLGASGSAPVTVPSSIVVPAGAQSARFPVTLGLADMIATSRISAVVGGTGVSADLSVYPLMVHSIIVSPAGVVGGASTSATVTLNAPAPEGGFAMEVYSKIPEVVPHPGPVTVAGNLLEVTFPIATRPVSQTVNVAISAGGVLSTNRKSTQLAVASFGPVSLVLTPSTILGGQSTIGTVNLSGPAPAGGTAVQVLTGHSGITVPSTVAVQAGATNARFSIATQPTLYTSAYPILARVNGIDARADLTLTPLLPTALVLSRSRVTGGQQATGRLTVNGAPRTTSTIPLFSSNTTVATVPAAVSIAAGTVSADFPVTTSPVGQSTVVSITAGNDVEGTDTNESRTVNLHVNAPYMVLISLACPSQDVYACNQAIGQIRLSGPAPGTGFPVTLSSNSAAVQVPASLTVAAGATTAQFSIATMLVKVPVTATITAVSGTNQLSAQFALMPSL